MCTTHLCINVNNTLLYKCAQYTSIWPRWLWTMATQLENLSRQAGTHGYTTGCIGTSSQLYGCYGYYGSHIGYGNHGQWASYWRTCQLILVCCASSDQGHDAFDPLPISLYDNAMWILVKSLASRWVEFSVPKATVTIIQKERNTFYRNIHFVIGEIQTVFFLNPLVH